MATSGKRWPGFSRKAEIEWVRKQRKTMLAELLRWEKERLGRRIAATRRLFPQSVFIGDIHCHTPFSDGVSTVVENKAVADAVGLDFLFVTDHRTIRHRRHCDGRAGVHWGQEPPSCGREIGVLMPRRLFVPRHDSLAADFARARLVAPFAWIPHPAGYGKSTRYPAEMAKQLWTLGDRFAMEILNGCQKLCSAYDGICQSALALLDELLCAGRQVTVLGASDAHICWSIGTAWTGVYATTSGSLDVIEALNRGHSFASEAPILWLASGSAVMGDVVRKRPGSKTSLRFSAADSLGLRSVRLVSQGRTAHEVQVDGAPCMSGEVIRTARKMPTYFRLEGIALDGRRAISSPLFIVPR